MNIRYAHSDEAWANFFTYLEALIKRAAVRRVLEVGGGSNPTFSLEFIAAQGLEYTLLDISADALGKAPQGYLKVQADIASPVLHIPGGYDLIFSRMLAEHVKSGETFHRNVYRLLAPGGRAFHFFPTLYALPFVVNRLLPVRLTKRLLHLLQAGREDTGRFAKFPAYYSWCRGPTPAQISRFESLGYQIDEYIGFFGHDGYYAKIPLLANMHRAFSNWLVRHPFASICSFAYVLLHKKSGS